VRLLPGGDGGKLELSAPFYLDLKPILVDEDFDRHFGPGRRELYGVCAGLGGGYLDIEASGLRKTGLASELRNELAGPGELA